jgi:Fe-S cluster assembly protein SufD
MQSFVSSASKAAFSNAVTEIAIGDGSRLEHVVWGGESEQSYHVGRTEISLGRDARYVGTSVWTGGHWSRLDTDIRFSAPGAECTLNGLYIGGGKQHIDHHTCIDHAVPHCDSRQLYKGILGGASKAIFNGRIHIHTDAQRSDSGMSNRNLLLTDKASVNTKPELEIYADDVKAAHGTTVGQLDENSIYYLRARGITRKSAERMLTSAFAADVLSELRLEPLQEMLMARVESRLDHVIEA